VIDTPPSRHAVDILSAPDRLTAFFGHPVYRTLIGPSRAIARVTSAAAGASAWAVKRLAGPQIVEDTLEFFQSISGLEDGLQRRAAAVSALLREPDTSFVLVSSPRAEAIDEARHLGEALRTGGYPLRAAIANLVHPLPPAGDFDDTAAVAGSALADQIDHHRELTALAMAEREELEALWTAVEPTSSKSSQAHVARCEIPLLGHDVHGLDSLAEIAALLGA